MSKSDEAKLREQRLAAKLRENLKRRKGQARARNEVAEKTATGLRETGDRERNGGS